MYSGRPDKGRKYSFVSDRLDDHGSLEFRCFGNVDNAVDAKKCLELTRDAFLYAMERYKSYVDMDEGTLNAEFELALVMFEEAMAA
jgi:hypothetical protein